MTTTGHEDVLLDLIDFLGSERAQKLLIAWLDPNPGALEEAVAVLIEEALDCGDPFEAALIPEAVRVCLTKQHTTRAGETRLDRIDALIGLAGEDPGRLLDAKYLAGRARWYLGGAHLPEAAAMLAESRRMARERAYAAWDADPLAHAHAAARIGQCSYYLGKICKKNFAAFQRAVARLADLASAAVQTQSAPWADALFREANSCGVDTGRADLRLLAQRELIGSYSRERRQEKVAELARLCAEGHEDCLDYFNIRKHLMTDLAILYRNSQSPEDRARAIELYDRCIKAGSRYCDHHRGMSLYLKSDLLRDELFEALSGARAAALAGDPEASRRCEDRASELMHLGRTLCEEACRALLEHPDRGVDGLALTKAQRRLLLFSHGSTLDRPITGHELTEAAAVQHAEINHLLLGFPLVGDESRPADLDRSPTWLNLELALNLILQLQVDPEDPAPTPIRLAGYLEPGSALVVPWQFGDNLAVQMYGCVSGPDEQTPKPILLQEAVVSGFISRLRPRVDALLVGEQGDEDSDYREFLDGPLRDTAFDRLSEHIEVFQVPPPGSRLRRAVVVRPRSNAEWVLPLEWLTAARTGTGEEGPALLELPEGIIWAGPGTDATGTFRLAVPPDRFAVFATDQLVSYRTELGLREGRVIDGVRELCDREPGYSLGELRELTEQDRLVVPSGFEGAIVIGHADCWQQLSRQLEGADWSGCRALGLLFCVSARYHLEEGVFLRGLAGRLKQRLGSDAVVIASRVPVLLEESWNMARLLLDPGRDPTHPLATLVSEYLRRRFADQPVNPFRSPWVVM